MTSTALSPPALAKQLVVDTHKVLDWIKSGELRAINVASTTTGRPRWRIMPADLDLFLLRRSAQPDVKPTRLRRKPARPLGWIDYF
jgi:hypothetical protein